MLRVHAHASDPMSHPAHAGYVEGDNLAWGLKKFGASHPAHAGYVEGSSWEVCVVRAAEVGRAPAAGHSQVIDT